MKKILFLLLSTIAMYGQVPADATPLENIQITNNQTSTTATKVNVQETDGTINTISKSDLVNVVEVNDVPSLPLVGDVGKIYVVKNLNKIYRWNGIFYQELAGSDLTYQSVIDALTFTPENVANKTSSFLSNSNISYPSSEALFNGLATKENTFSKNTAFNKNFGTTAGTVAEGNDSRILNGQTAFGWGNHAGLYPTYNGTGATGTWGINISGNSGSATNWGGRTADLGNLNTAMDLLVSRGLDGVFRLSQPSQIQSFLGLGSNAYTSTAYLPLSGGTLTGVLNGTSATFASSVTATGFFQSSDRRLKYIHKRDGDVAYFTWKDGRDDKMHIGWIAQEIRKQFPDQVQKNEDGYLSVSYIEILVAKNRELEKRLEALENRINQLEKSK